MPKKPDVDVVAAEAIYTGAVFVRFIEKVSKYVLLEKKIACVPAINAPFYFKGELYRVRDVSVLGGSENVGFEVVVQKPIGGVKRNV